MQITLTPQHKELIERKLASGQYASPSDVVRDALFLLEANDIEREARLVVLRAEIQKGIDSGPPIPADAAFRELRARIAGKRKSKRRSKAA